jgi:hypothetical protein
LKIGGRQHFRVAAGLRDGKAAGLQPSTRNYVLGVAELRRQHSLAAEVGRLCQGRVALNDQRGPAIRGAGDDAHTLAARFRIGVNGRIGANIGEVD